MDTHTYLKAEIFWEACISLFFYSFYTPTTALLQTPPPALPAPPPQLTPHPLLPKGKASHEESTTKPGTLS